MSEPQTTHEQEPLPTVEDVLEVIPEVDTEDEEETIVDEAEEIEWDDMEDDRGCEFCSGCTYCESTCEYDHGGEI